MHDTEPPNIHTPAWEREIDHAGFGLRGSRLGTQAGTRELGLGVFELAPRRRNLPYHAHYGIEEAIVVLSGRPTLRSPQGERELAEGEVVACLAGADGAHQLINHGSSPVRYLVISTRAAADVIEYPDSGKVAAHGGALGSPGSVSHLLSVAATMGYFEGEPGEPG